MGIEPLAKEYFEVFCGSSIARMDDFKALYLSRNGKTETSKGGRDKGHRREVELTLEAMKQGKDAPIPFEELIEVTEATFAVEEAIRTQRTVHMDGRAVYDLEIKKKKNRLPPLLLGQQSS